MGEFDGSGCVVVLSLVVESGEGWPRSSADTGRCSSYPYRAQPQRGHTTLQSRPNGRLSYERNGYGDEASSLNRATMVARLDCIRGRESCEVATLMRLRSVRGKGNDRARSLARFQFRLGGCWLMRVSKERRRVTARSRLTLSHQQQLTTTTPNLHDRLGNKGQSSQVIACTSPYGSIQRRRRGSAFAKPIPPHRVRLRAIVTWDRVVT